MGIFLDLTFVVDVFVRIYFLIFCSGPLGAIPNTDNKYLFVKDATGVYGCAVPHCGIL